ncbi:MAG: queuosine precursor transporter [Bacteroidia bacterium]|nr:queuosine precursor transporter [Bacteroidia bacterium]MDW8159633.1 queuosine precursor transporter [Bacteroidia bacterium]
MTNKVDRLFLVLGLIFITNALLAEFIGVKIFSLEQTLGFDSFQFSFFSEDALGFNMSAGAILWPIVFIMSDIINEYFGKKGVRILSFYTVGLILYAFLIAFITIELTPADFWRIDKETALNMDLAFRKIFGQGMWIIIASVTSFLISQLLDVIVFHRLKRITGSKKIWLRATGSTLVSQLVDSFVVLYIAFFIGGNWNMAQVLSIGIVNYIYKFVVAILLTPLLYIIHFIIDNYLGHELAAKLTAQASQNN